MKITVELEREDYNAMHDVILEALNLESEISDKTIKTIWDNLPEHIQGDAIQWGCDDTVFRDNMYVWLEKNSKKMMFLI
jgi:hypothetical protein